MNVKLILLIILLTLTACVGEITPTPTATLPEEPGPSVETGTYVEPHKATTRHWLKNAEVYYIVEGQGLMHIDDEANGVRAGDTIYVPPGAVQHIENHAETDLVFLCIVDPAWQQADEEILTFQ